jgi:hypothetical protein
MLPVLNVLVRYIIAYCVILFLHNLEWRIETVLATNTNTQHTTAYTVTSVVTKIMRSADFFFNICTS